MIKITYDDATFSFSDKDINDMAVYDHIHNILEKQNLPIDETHNIASDVQGWAELAVIDEEYDLSEYDIIVECTED